LLKSLGALRGKEDAVIVMDQVSEPEAGTVKEQVREVLFTSCQLPFKL
jgi:hypothetical protein